MAVFTLFVYSADALAFGSLKAILAAKSDMQSSTTPSSFWKLHRSVFLWLILVIAICPFLGCRSFGQRKPNPMSMAAARQLRLRGADALQQQKYSDAEALFAESLRHSPNDEQAHWGLAEVLYQRGECNQAAQHMNEAAKISGNDPARLVRLGEMQMEAGQVDQAMVQADMALASDWQSAKAWELRGRVLEKRGQSQEAMEAYHRSLLSQPNNPAVQIALASIYLQLDRPQRALATIERMSDLQNPSYDKADTWLLKGTALARLGQTEESRHCLKEASQRVNGANCELCLQLAKLQSEVGDWSDARANLGRVLSQYPNHPDALLVQQQLEKRFREQPGAGSTIPATGTGKILYANGPLQPPLQPFSTSPNQNPLPSPTPN
ncbi:MAG: tetratricopeptide repeat protein [Pirellulales bacterium]